MIGGDFNLIRSPEDKSSGNIDFRWVDRFNEWVEIWALMEINLAGRAYTWGNNQENLIMSKIDRIFCSTNFESMFPLSNARTLARIGSDHTPIIWESGETQIPKKLRFKFEKWWLARPDFRNVVVKAWDIVGNSADVIDVWQSKVRYFRKLARGWSANLEAAIRK
uniref:Uncharacterized protein n=1 Tax=Avena sativa TaxID=4498 RepID=A0ACD5Z2B2_AVESA